MFDGGIDERMFVGLLVYCYGDYVRKFDRDSGGLLRLLANDTKNYEKFFIYIWRGSDLNVIYNFIFHRES